MSLPWREGVSLPSAVWCRWGLRDGGRVACLDLGDAVVFAPAVLKPCGGCYWSPYLSRTGRRPGRGSVIPT